MYTYTPHSDVHVFRYNTYAYQYAYGTSCNTHATNILAPEASRNTNTHPHVLPLSFPFLSFPYLYGTYEHSVCLSVCLCVCVSVSHTRTNTRALRHACACIRRRMLAHEATCWFSQCYVYEALFSLKRIRTQDSISVMPHSSMRMPDACAYIRHACACLSLLCPAVVCGHVYRRHI
jgi:hypothetical protein